MISTNGLLFVLIATLTRSLWYFLQPLESAAQRRFEREADDLALALIGTAEAVRRALKRLAADNLANWTPPSALRLVLLFSSPLLERIKRLGRRMDFEKGEA